MNGEIIEGDRPVLLQIQNNRKPELLVQLVLEQANGHLETVGLKTLFGLKEIRLETSEVLASLPEYAEVLSYLLEAMSSAQDLNLPFVYQDEFEFHDVRYTIYDEGKYRVLKRADPLDTLDS